MGSRRRRGRGARPHVLIIVQNLPVPFDRRVWLQARALVSSGYRVSVVCPRGPGDPSFEVLDGVRLHKYRPPPQTRGALSFVVEFVYCWLATALLTARIARRDHVDVVQACNPPDTYFALAWFLKLTGTRFVFDQHDLNPELYRVKFGRDDLLLRGLLLLERLTYRTADHVIATNASYRDVARTRGGRREEDVTIVRNGPDPARMRRGEAHPELRRGRRLLCCYLGVMGPQDGLDVVLDVVETIVRERGRDDVSFALLGSGDCYDDLRADCTRRGLDDVVEFTGRADDAMIAAYLSTADVALSPDPSNAFNDVSTMNKTMEYMAFSLPVVAFDLPETRVSAADAAVYVSPGDVRGYADAVIDLLDAPERRAQLGAAGRRRVEDVLAWAHSQRVYLDVYAQLTGGPVRPAGEAPVPTSALASDREPRP